MTTLRIEPDSIWIERKDFNGDKDIVKVFDVGQYNDMNCVMFEIIEGRNACGSPKNRRAWSISGFRDSYEPYIVPTPAEQRVEELEDTLRNLKKALYEITVKF